MRNLAIAAVIVGLVSLVVGAISYLVNAPICGISSRVFGGFTVMCFLLSINLLLLEKKS